MRTALGQRWIVRRLLLLVTVLGVPAFGMDEPAAQSNGGPIAACHSTDGAFTLCPGGGTEWSDVPARSFPETQSFLYASQADLDPTKGSPLSAVDTFMLMYDECGRTTRLGPDDYFLVSFKTVETDGGIEKLEHYVIHIFTDGTILFIENGSVHLPGRAPLVDGMRGAVGFGRSPNCSVPHVIAEFEIPLSVTGNSYSPDPLFWSAGFPEPPCQPGATGVRPLQNDPCSPEPPRCPSATVQVQLLVNVLDGVDVDDTTIEEMVREANAVLAQADVCLAFDATTGIRRNGPSTGGAGNNGQIDNDIEEFRVRTDCERELVTTPGIRKGTGLKVALTSQLLGDPFLLGQGGFSLPCVNIAASPGLGFEMGDHLAHEIGHVFLPPGHLVDNRGTPGTGDDIFADASGHFDHPASLMHPNGSGTELTDAQRATLKDNAKGRAPNSEHGAWVDGLGDTSQPQIDLLSGSLYAPGFTSDLEISVNVSGSHVDGTQFTSTFDVLFDTDQNAITGGRFGSFDGIDKIVRISLAGQFPFSGPNGSMIAALVDVATGASTPLAGGRVEHLRSILDSRTGPPKVFDFGDSIHQSVPLPLLALSAGTVPMGIRGANAATGEVDEVGFLLDVSLTPGLRAVRSGFNADTLPPNDDGSTGSVPLGFTTNFFGTPFSSLFVNNNGNVTFDAPLASFTPFGLTGTRRVIIAPFFADVDTTIGNVVRFGAGAINGRPAFGVSWPGVGCYRQNTSVLDFFQMVLIDRSDITPADFDIEFNYDSIQWETGQFSGGNAACLGGDSARVGFSNGSAVPGTFFELSGSGINGAFVDANTTTGLIHNSRNSNVAGRYVFEVRNGVPVIGDGDGVPDDVDNCPATPNPEQQDRNLNGIGDACETSGVVHSTAAFMQAGFDGTTFVEPHSLLVSNEPSLLEQLVRIVNFRLAAGLASSAPTLASHLVASLVALNLVPSSDANALIAAVLQQVATPSLRGDIDGDGDVDLNDLNFILVERGKPTVGSVCGKACDLDDDGKISALDARILVTLCTRAQCKTQ